MPKKKKVSKLNPEPITESFEPEPKPLPSVQQAVPEPKALPGVHRALSEPKATSAQSVTAGNKPLPGVQREVLIDPNLFAGKAMLLIDAIEQEIREGHASEWQMVADRLEQAVKTLRAMPTKKNE